ncbi:MAG: choice-of-anchor B family protein [Bacteroidota bacterium]
MSRLFVLACLSLLFSGLQSQISSNMTLLGQYDDNSLPLANGLVYNDIWGYAANGREYALLGSLYKIHFLEVTDPTNIEEIAAIEATLGSSNSIWRDMKTYSTYAYSVADQNGTTEGLMVFDLSNINGPDPVNPGDPERVTLVRQVRADFNRAHNIFIDVPNGMLYVVGVDVSGVDMIVYDLNTDPSDPTLVGEVSFDAGYIHDVFVEDHRAYCSHLTDGLYIYDMSPLTAPGANPPGEPIELGLIDGYPYQVFNHSSWVDGDLIVFADERHGSPLKSADISNLNDIQIQDYFYSNLLNVDDPFSPSSPRGPIAHNPFLLGNYCFASYYHDGVSVFDVSDPTDVIQVAYYDTEPDNTNYNGSDGSWGIYPYLPSGNILASDMLNGLFVLDFFISVPVEWETFTAKAESAGVRLDWSTSRQEDNRGFSVQRQTPDGGWEDIAWEAADPSQHYRVMDKSPWPGWNVYRIMQQDFDGTRDYSEWRSVYFKQEAEDWRVGPNPIQSGGRIYVRGSSQPAEKWQLLNATGAILWEGTATVDDNQAQFRLPDIPAGLYWLRTNDNSFSTSLLIE